MWIWIRFRIQLITLMRIRILLLNLMRIHPDLDPPHCVKMIFFGVVCLILDNVDILVAVEYFFECKTKLAWTKFP
jgi:hypothetical protein